MEAFGRKSDIIDFNYEKHGYGVRDFFPFHDYEYYLDTREVSKVYKPSISLEEGLKRALEWYMENENKVMKRKHYMENCEKIK